MIVAGSASPLLLASAAGGYNLTRSLRFRRDASAFLNRTPASAGNGTTWTWSGWVKRGSVAASNLNIFGAGWSGSGWLDAIRFTDNFGFQFAIANSSSFVGQLRTTQLFRDPSAWYHIVCVWDTTQATASNRMRLFVNGSQVTALSTATYPSQNQSTTWINQAQVHRIGSEAYLSGSDYYDGQMAEMNFIDGQALNATSFGEFSATTGVWQPKKYAGTYGTNGFYLPFTNNSTTTTLGNDFSGNGNNWTTNNFSLTAGSTYDSMTDVPTLTSATAANFAVLNPLYNYPTPTLTNGNLTTTNNGTLVTGALSTIGVTSGKWYFEATNTTTVNQSTSIGIVDSTFNFNAGAAYIINGTTYRITGNPTFASYTNGDTIGVAFDASAGTISFYKNGTLQGTGNYSYLTNGTPVFPYVYIRDDATGSWNANFGQRPFAYTPPTGFVALNTFNLPTPTIGATASTQANKYFNSVLYTGNGADPRTISGVGFAPDFTWIKRRSAADNHILVNKLTGTGFLQSNTTDAEGSASSVFQALASDGFTVGNDTSVNANGSTYVAWNWKANGTGVSNTAGSITSTVSANTSSGFSVVTYTGTGSASDTVGHGLGVAPSMVITKRRSSGSGAFNWMVKHRSLASNHNLLLESTSASTDVTTGFGSGGIANLTSSTTFGFLNGTSGNPNNSNTSGATYVAYCFSQIAGYSAFGSYTGNGSSDGTFVSTGFMPRYVMMKRTDSTGDWQIFDTSRSPTNVASNALYANGSFAEDSNVTNRSVDFLSNGFKIRSSGTFINASGGTFIYMAFAENPLKYSLAH